MKKKINTLTRRALHNADAAYYPRAYFDATFDQ